MQTLISGIFLDIQTFWKIAESQVECETSFSHFLAFEIMSFPRYGVIVVSTRQPIVLKREVNRH